MDKPEGLIGLREAARRLGVGSYTIRKLVKRGELRGFRVRALIRISPLDLENFLKRNMITGADLSNRLH